MGCAASPVANYCRSAENRRTGGQTLLHRLATVTDMRLAAFFAAVDALAGLYLIGYGISRERRDAAGVICVGVVLMVMGGFLGITTLVR